MEVVRNQFAQEALAHPCIPTGPMNGCSYWAVSTGYDSIFAYRTLATVQKMSMVLHQHGGATLVSLPQSILLSAYIILSGRKNGLDIRAPWTYGIQSDWAHRWNVQENIAARSHIDCQKWK